MSTFKKVSGSYTLQTLNSGDEILLDSSVVTMDAGAVNITGDLTVVGNAVLTGNVNADRIFYGTSNVEIPTLNGNVTVSVGGTSNVAIFNTTGLEVPANISGGNLSLTGAFALGGNISAGNLITSGNILVARDASVGTPTVRFQDTDTTIADGQVIGQVEWYTDDATAGSRVTSAIRSIASGTGGNANIQILTSTSGGAAAVRVTILHTGNVGIANAAPTDALAVSGNIYSSAIVTAVGNVIGGNVLTAGLVSATGNVTGGNVLTGGQVSATGNITGGNAAIAGLITAGAAGITATGNVRGGNLLSDGIISATGNLTTTDIFASGTVSATGNLYGGNVNVGAASVTGSISTSSISITNGAVINGSLTTTGNALGVTQYRVATANVDISGIGSPLDITPLYFYAAANKRYQFTSYLSMVPDGSMTISPCLSFSAGDCYYTTETQQTSTGAFQSATKNDTNNTTTTYSSTGTTVRTLRISGTFYHTADTLVQWRFQTNTGTMTFLPGSYIAYTAVSS